MGLEERIQNDLLTATKEKNTGKVEALRLVKSEILKAKTAPGFNGVLTDPDVEKIMQKMCKEREDSASIYKDANRQDLVDKELAEIRVISEYLPKQADISEVTEAVKKAIAELGATTMKDMGPVIKKVSSELGSRSDGKTISGIVRELLK